MNNNLKVLIVDDEERFRKTTALVLERGGFEVVTAMNGEEAVEKVRKSDFDVIILDVKMPKMDGNEALKEIRKIKPEAAVIMLTGHGTPESALEGLMDGVYDYLTKPCSIDVLAKKIKEAAGNKDLLKHKEPKVRHIMVPLTTFSHIEEHRTVAEAIEEIFNSFSRTVMTNTVHETVHRSILVMDVRDNVTGIVTFTDLLENMMPDYLKILGERTHLLDSPFMSTPNFSGMFTLMARDLAKKTVKDVMSDAPPTIDVEANLMEAASRLLSLNVRRLLVMDGGKVVGVVREQDLFFEMTNIIRLERK